MQLNKRASHLLELAQKVYPFSFSLLGDDISAYQLVVDSISRLELDEHQNMNLENLYKVCFELAKKSPSLANSKKVFHRLSLEEKAIIFLKEKEGLSFEQISNVVGIDKVNIHVGLTSARNSLFELIGETF